VSGDEIKNISEEEAGFEDASEDAFNNEDTGEDEIKNISEEEAGFQDASEDALKDEDTGEDETKNISEEGAGVKDASEDALADSEVTQEEAEVKWVIRNAVDEGEMMKQDEAPKNGEDIKKELSSAADITDDPEDMGEEGR
jgi:hypothetical protein